MLLFSRFLAILDIFLEGYFMKNSKLINVLQTFSKPEVLKFREFVNSPYFNKNKNVISLAEEILDNYPDFDDVNFTEENIYKKIFSGKYEYFKIKNVISDLLGLALTFLKISSAEKKDTDLEINLLNILHDRKLDTLYAQREKKINDRLEKLQAKDEDVFLNEYQLERINTAHYQFDRSTYTFGRIQKEFDSFFNYSIVGLLRLYAKQLHNRNHGNIKFNMEMFDNVWSYVKNKVIENNPSYMIYRQLIKLELSRSEEDYRELLRLKEIYSEKLPSEELYYALLVQNSYAVYRLKLGDESYYKDRFYAFREIMKNKFMSTEYIIFPNFITVFTSACMADEYKWAEDFLKSAQNGISPLDEKMNATNYCKAFLAYRKKDFDNALKLFSKTKFKLYLMKVMVRSYSVRIYYEQGLYEQALSAIDSFRHYLKAEKLMDEPQKEAHYEFMRYLNRLIEFKIEGINKKNKADLNVYVKQIEKMKANPLGAKNWLLQKAEQLQ